MTVKQMPVPLMLSSDTHCLHHTQPSPPQHSTCSILHFQSKPETIDANMTIAAFVPHSQVLAWCFRLLHYFNSFPVRTTQGQADEVDKTWCILLWCCFVAYKHPDTLQHQNTGIYCTLKSLLSYYSYYLKVMSQISQLLQSGQLLVPGTLSEHKAWYITCTSQHPYYPAFPLP